MKKKILLTFMVIAIGILAFGVVSVSNTIETVYGAVYDYGAGLYEYSIWMDKALITGCSESLNGAITIPSYIGGYEVGAIEAYAFENNEKLTSVNIPEGITSIGRGAFSNCDNLTSITVSKNNPNYISVDGVLFDKYEEILIAYPSGRIGTTYSIPNGVLSIDWGAFSGCDTLTRVDFPNSLTWISTNAFYGCNSLSSVDIPDSVMSIAPRAFGACKSLKNINISVDNEFYSSVDGVVFNKDKTTLIVYPSGRTKAEIPDSVTTIGDSAFWGCSNLTNIEIPDSVSTIEYGAFVNCKNLISVEISNSVTAIGDEAFTNCESLTSIEIPDGVTKVGSYVFYNCNSLTNIEIPNSVTTIEFGAFSNCSSLTSIAIGSNVTKIENYAFNNCYCLSVLYYNGPKAKWESISIGSDNTLLTNATKHYVIYVTLLDKNGNKIDRKIQDIGEVFDTSTIVVPDGYIYSLYTDKELTMEYNKDNSVSKNLTLYVDFVKLNAIKFEGVNKVDIGEHGIIEKVNFATDKEAKYFSCTLKIPSNLVLREIKSDNFRIEQDSQVIGDDTYFYLFSIYDGEGSIPMNKKIIPFELVIDVSENIIDGEVALIEILDDANLADDDGNSHTFVSIENAEITIGDVLATLISISSDIGTWDKEYSFAYNDYTIYVPSGTASLKLTTNHNGTLVGDGKTFISNVAKTISLPSNETILILNYICDGYKNNTYTITIKKGEDDVEEPKQDFEAKVNLINDKVVITADIADIAQKKHIHAAIYNDDNRMIDYIIVPSIYSNNTVNIVFRHTLDMSFAKVFVWESFETIKPFVEAVTLPLK